MLHFYNNLLDIIPYFQPSQFLEAVLSNVYLVLISHNSIPFISHSVLGSALRLYLFPLDPVLRFCC